jgi:citronellyl-CoA dehydrogenase
MNFTQEHEEIRRNLRRLIDNEINPHVDAWEAAEQFPAHEVFRKLGKLGLLGLTKPEAYGGAGLDWSYAMVMAETLGHIRCGGVPMAIGVQTDMATPALARHGSDELRKEFLAPSIAGDYVACIGVSEPGAGSDVASIKTTAKKDRGDYVINGGKMWITNSLQADWMCLLANTSAGAPHKNKTLICLPMKAKGVTKSKIDKIGMMASDTGLIHFDDVRVPQRYRIGEEGLGFTYQMQQFQEERLWAAASAIEGMMRTLHDTIEYVRERRMFGQTVLDFQYVPYRLAELKTEIEALRALSYRACERYVSGEDVTELASMAKLKAGRLKREVTDACLQYWGGMGYTWDNPVSRAFRDGRLMSIGGGADEVMLGIICKYMGILPAKHLEKD